MTADDNANVIYVLLLMMLIGSALFARQIPMRKGLKMALGWLVIFFIAFAAFTLRDDFRLFSNRLTAEWTGGAIQQGSELRIPRAEDGHYWIEGRLNGQPVRFLIDSGATMTSIGKATADRAQIEVSGGFPVAVETANGTVTAERARAKSLQIGDIAREDFPIHVSEAFGDTNVLGMNFLSSLSSWGVEGTWLVLRP